MTDDSSDQKPGGANRADQAGSDRGPAGKDAMDEIVTRLGGLAGALTDAFGKIAEKLSEVDAASKSGAPRDVSFDAGDGPVSARAGFSVKVGGLAGAEPEEKPDFEVKRPTATARGPAAPGLREAEIELYEEPTLWIATVELPGAAAEDVALRVADGLLSVETTGARQFRGETALPDNLDPEGLLDRAETRLANGILEIRLPKGAAPAPEPDSQPEPEPAAPAPRLDERI